MSKRWLSSALLTVSLVCGLWSGSSQSGLKPPILRLSMENEPVTLDWNRARSSTDRFILSFLMRGLLKYDENGKLACDLCTTYELSADRKVLTFHLRSEEQWSDGVKLEAEQFADSFRRLLDPAVGATLMEDFRIIEGAPQSGAKKWDPKKLGVKTPDKQTLQITLSKPLSIFPHLLTTVNTFPIRKELLRPKDTGEEHATVAVLGPYNLAAWEHGKRVVIEWNRQFTGSEHSMVAKIARVQFELGTHAQQAKRYTAGQLEILTNPTTEDLIKVPGQKIQVNPYWATRILIPNVKHKTLSDLSFRRALLHVLDRDSLPQFLRNGERRATGVVPPGLAGYRELPLATVDLARAKSEREHSASGTQPVELELLLQDSETEKRVAQWLSDQLQKVGVKLKLRPRKSAAFFGEIESGKFDLALVTWSFGIASPTEILRTFQTQSSLNRGKWTNVAYDGLVSQLFTTASQEQNPAEFAKLIDESSQILEVQEVGVIPLGYPTQPFLTTSRITNFATTPFGDPDLVKIQIK